MGKRLLPIVAILALFALAASAFGDTEEDIIAKYLKKTEKKHVTKLGFASASFGYGRLGNIDYYQSVNFAASSDAASLNGTLNPIEGIWRSNEISLNFGLMVAQRFALSIGFDYWLKMSTDANVDYTATIGVLEVEESYDTPSNVDVYGFNAGVSYYLTNPPTPDNGLAGLAVKVGGGGGIYMTKWNFWQDQNEDAEPVSASAPAFWLQGGVEYPIGFLDLVIGADGRYFFLNFNDLNSYNEMSGDMELTYSSTGNEYELDFSGLRAQIGIRRYFKW